MSWPLALVFVSLIANASCGEEAIESFRNLKSSLDHIESRIANCSLQLKYATKKIIDEKTFRDQFTIVATLDDSTILFKQADTHGNYETVEGLNDQYCFAVSKEKSGKFSLLQLEDLNRIDAEVRHRINGRVLGVKSMLFRPYVIGGLFFIWDLFDDIGFKLTSCEEFEWFHKKCIKVSFEFAGEDPRGSGREGESNVEFVGWLVCDPSAHWAVVEQFIKGSSSDTHGSLRLIETQNIEHGIVVSTKFLNDYVSESEVDRSRTRLFEVSQQYPQVSDKLVEILPAPDRREFYLTAYGFPEPNFRKSYSWWLFYLVAGIAVSAFGYFLLRRDNR